MDQDRARQRWFAYIRIYGPQRSTRTRRRVTLNRQNDRQQCGLLVRLYDRSVWQKPPREPSADRTASTSSSATSSLLPISHTMVPLLVTVAR